MLTTYRLTEHHTAGGMSRTVPFLSELQPEMFWEVSPELAAERGLEHGGWATVVTMRQAIEARLDRREGDGRVWKRTLCYDRLADDLEPACAKACPHELDPVRRARRAARAGAQARRAPARRRDGRGSPLR